MARVADVWSEFEADPRDPANASLRASDQDRDIVQQALGDAYAAGRLSRDELDERSDRALAGRTLGDLPPLLTDLVPTSSPGAPPALRGPGTVSTEQLTAQATERWRRERREAVWGALSVSLVCCVIWALTGMGFFWPGFVLLGTGMNVGRVLFMRESYIVERTRQLERRQQRELERRERRRDSDD